MRGSVKLEQYVKYIVAFLLQLLATEKLTVVRDIAQREVSIPFEAVLVSKALQHNDALEELDRVCAYAVVFVVYHVQNLGLDQAEDVPCLLGAVTRFHEVAQVLQPIFVDAAAGLDDSLDHLGRVIPQQHRHDVNNMRQ